MTSYCDLCGIHLQRDSLPSHISGKRHQKAASLQQQQQQQTDRSVYIPALPPHTTPTDLKAYFNQFGPVQHLHLHKKGFAFVEFRSRDVVAAVLNHPRPHALRGGRFRVAPKKLKKFTGPPKGPPSHASQAAEAEEVPIDHKDVEQQLEDATDVGTQMEILRSYLLLKEDDHKKRKNVLQEIKNVLEQHVPGVEVHAFGSSANGFGFRGSDIDIFADLCLDKIPNANQNKSPCPQLPFIRDLEALKVVGGRVTKASLKNLNLVQRAKFVSRMLKQHKAKFTEVFVVPSQRCPVVRFVHMPSRVKCDLSISSSLAVRNTNLIRLLCAVDGRFTELMPTIRYWAKIFKVAGSVTTAPLFSNYTLVLLVIFYLQQGEQPVLPSIEELGKLADSRTIIEDWDCSMPSDPSAWKHTISSGSTEDLLRGFFEFYANLDFSSSVLCMRSGRRVDIAEFRESMRETPQLEAFKIGSINVQDPFVLSHNTSFGVNEKWAKSISESFNLASSRCQSAEFSLRKSPWGLLLLLSPDTSTSRPPPKGATNQVSSPMGIGGMDFSFAVEYVVRKLADRFFSSVTGEDVRQVMWLKDVVKVVRTLMVDVMACEWDVQVDKIQDMMLPVTEVKTKEEEEAMEISYELDPHDPIQEGDVVSSDVKNDTNDVNNDSVTSSDLNVMVTVDPEEVSGSSEDQTSSDTQAVVSSGEKRKSDQSNNGNIKRICLTKETRAVSSGEKLLDVRCQSHHRMWLARQQARQHVRKTSSTLDTCDKLAAEKEVSDYMRGSRDHPPSPQVALNFRMALTFDKHCLTIHMQPLAQKKEFPNVYQLMKTLILKCVEQAVHKRQR